MSIASLMRKSLARYLVEILKDECMKAPPAATHR